MKVAAPRTLINEVNKVLTLKGPSDFVFRDRFVSFFFYLSVKFFERGKKKLQLKHVVNRRLWLTSRVPLGCRKH